VLSTWRVAVQPFAWRGPFLRVQSSASVRHRTKAKISALGSRHAMWRAVCSWMNACELFELDLYVTMHGGVPCIFLRAMLASGSLPGDAAPTASPIGRGGVLTGWLLVLMEVQTIDPLDALALDTGPREGGWFLTCGCPLSYGYTVGPLA